MNELEQLQQLLNQNPFTILNQPLQFNVDQNILDQHYQMLQRKYHPDNFVTASAEIKLLIIQVSAHINHAYTTLKSPLSRSIVLLALNGIHLDLAQDTSLPEQFLFEQMELHEEIDEARNSIKGLEKIEANLATKINHFELEIEQAFRNKNFIEVTELTKQLAFYTKLNNSVADIITNLY